MIRDSDRIDFFLSRAGAEAALAQALAQALEARGRSVILQDWDFRSTDFVAQMDRALQRSNRTIVLLSKSYLLSPFCGAEWRATFAQDPSNMSNTLCVLNVDGCHPQGLLGLYGYLDLSTVLPDTNAAVRLALAWIEADAPRAVSESALKGWKAPLPICHQKVAQTAHFTERQEQLDKLGKAAASNEGQVGCVIRGIAGAVCTSALPERVRTTCAEQAGQ